MKLPRASARNLKLSVVSRNRKYNWLLLFLLLVTASSLWNSVASASCNFLSTLASFGSGDGQVLTPRAIAIDPSDNVFVADQNDRVQKFNSSGVFQFKFATGGSSAGAVVAASGVAVDRTTGDIYVCDGFSERTSGIVQKFNASGDFQLAWGTSGSGPGQFLNGAGGVAVDSGGNVYVTDLGNHRVEKFTSGGSFITSWGGSGTGDGHFGGPEGIAIDAADNIYIADTGNHRIQKFDTSGTFLTKWGTNGPGDGQFDTPWGVSVDVLGDVYVADTNNNRIQKFSATGTFISSCGTSGSGNDQFSGPQDVGADSTGNYYVADTGNDRVQKFGAGGAAPIANAGSDQTAECAGATTSVTLDGTASTPGTGSINSYSWAESATSLGTGSTLMVSLSEGSHTITLTVTDTGGGSDTDDVVVNIVDTTSPIITCPANITINASPGSCSAAVSFTVMATDNCSIPTVVSSPASGSVFPLGTTTVTATATDAAGNSRNCSFSVTVKDVTGPVITTNGQTIELWPPNHKYRTVRVTDLVTSVSDLCDPSVGLGSVRIATVTSDEPNNSGGDGNTTNDIVIAADCKSVQLRSERMGGGNGRVYTITFKVTDASGNVSTATAKVTVPHSQPGSAAVDDGPHYTVLSGCP